MTINASLQPMRFEGQAYVGPTNWGLHYDSETWLQQGRFDIAVVIAQTAYNVTLRRILHAGTARAVLKLRVEAHPRWRRYLQLKRKTRDAFTHEGVRPGGSEAREFVECVGELMKLMEALTLADKVFAKSPASGAAEG